jgi:crotonobetainyl-CoA:carnitine CoA-transferase CaiB-like acyl-CoA transferase
MVDALVHFNLVEHLGGHTFVPSQGAFGWSRILVPERTPYRTRDGFVCLLPYSDANWADFFEVAGLGHLVQDPRFASMHSRNENMGELMSIVHDVTPDHSTQEWLDVCHARNIPASPLLDLRFVQDDEYVQDQGLVVQREHPTEGAYLSMTTPIRMSASPVVFARHAPHLGEHSIEALRGIGFSDEEIGELLAAGVISASGGLHSVMSEREA